MTRMSQFKLAGIPLHIIHKGDHRFMCFYTGEDYHSYLACLKAASQAEKIDIHAYVLMTDHVHLLVSPRCEHSVYRMMMQLGQRYTRYFNKKYYHHGDLWEDRFRSCIIDAENYLLTCQRYIELNPVRSGIVSKPSEYIWSSYLVNTHGLSPDFITPHAKYNALGADDAERRKVYRELFRQQLDPQLVDQINEHTNGGYCLGSDQFKLEIELMLGRRVIRGKQDRPAARLQIRSRHYESVV